MLETAEVGPEFVLPPIIMIELGPLGSKNAL